MARPRKFEEEDALEAARDKFWELGYEATSMSDLSTATGLGTQSLYNTFGNKHALFVRILDDYADIQVKALEKAFASSEDPWDSAISAVTFQDADRLALRSEGCLMANSAAALSAHDEDVRACTVRMYTGVREAFCEQIQRAKDCGEIGEDLDVEETARALLTVMQGVEYLRKCGIDDEEFVRVRDAAAAMVARAVIEM